MIVQVSIPQVRVDIVRDMVKDLLGRDPSYEELQNFFATDVEALYGDNWKGGLEDAVESFFYTEEEQLHQAPKGAYNDHTMKGNDKMMNEPGTLAFADMVRMITALPPGISFNLYHNIKHDLRVEEELGFESADEKAEVLKEIAADHGVTSMAAAWIYYSGV